MENILLISENVEQWVGLEKTLSGHYSFIKAESPEKAEYGAGNNAIRIIAVDNAEVIGRIPSSAKKLSIIVFFANEYNSDLDILARKNGASDFFAQNSSEELNILRFQKVSEQAALLKASQDSVRWLQMTKSEMKKLQEGMSEIMARTVESRDENTGGHVIRTATFMSMLGDEFVFSGDIKREQLDLIVMATPLHDIGKIGVHDAILLKPGPLSEGEFTEMKNHPEIGASLITKMQKRFPSHTYLKYAHDIALNHHERFDGKGYPNGKKGDEIPFWARLMSVVDVYDALVSDRVYRKGMPKEKAYEIIFSGKGTQFDPVVLEAFDNCKDLLI